MHQAPHLVRRQEDRGAAFVGHEEAVAVGMAFDATREHRDALGDEQRARAVLHHFAGTLERRQAELERAALAAADLESLGELLRRERLARALELAQDLARVVVGGRFGPLGAGPSAQRGSTGTLFWHSFFQLKSRPRCRGGGIGRLTRFRS